MHIIDGMVKMRGNVYVDDKIMKFGKLTKLKHKEINEETIIHYPEIEDLCYYPYPNHLNGCPNRIKCQMLNIPSFDIIKDCGEYFYYYLVYLEFDFKKYKEFRKIEKPSFFNTKERLKCVLYWQGSLKKIIKDYIEELKRQNLLFYVLGCGSGFTLSFQKQVGSMENARINVFSTLKLNGIDFEVKPTNKIILCNLLCSKKKISFKKNTREKWIKL